MRLTALVFFLMSFALAQTGAETLPLIRLSSFSVSEGEDLTLSASELTPDVQYELSLTSPEGVESTETLQADSEGNLEYTVQLDEVGRWQLGLDELNFSVPIEVQEAPEESLTESQADPPATLDDASNETSDETSDLQEETNEAFEPIVTPDDSGASDEAQEAESDAGEAQPDSEQGADEGSVDDSETADEVTAPASTPDAETSETESQTLQTEETGLADETEPVTPDRAARRYPLESLATALGRSGWYGVLSLLVATLALHLVLTSKYWRPRSVNLERQRILGRSVNPLFRAMTIRYYSLTEKLVILLLLLAAAVMAALASWASGGSVANTWNGAIIGIFTNPWNGLLDLRPIGLNLFIWMFIIVIFLAVFLFTLVWLFIPRPRWVANAPRGVLYHLLAVLVPGSGLADEMWGLLLMIPWALFGLDALIDLLGWGFGLGLSLFWDLVILGIIYLINLVAVIVEFMSYRRRMNTLKRENPELAQEFGMLRPVQ